MNIYRVSRTIMIGIGAAFLVAAGAQAGGGPSESGEGIVKLTNDADGQFFFADTNSDLLWDAADGDAKFRIQGGALTGVKFVQGDLSGNSQTQLGLADSSKFYFESGNFGWTPGSDAGDINFFFAPDVGLITVGTGDWNLGGRDCVMKVGTDNFIFVDANCSDGWEGQGGGDGKFRIQGGAEAGIYFVIDDKIGLFTANKYYIESGDFNWTPGSDAGDINGFFAPNVGAVVAVVVSDFNGDGVEDFAKIVDDGFIYADLNGNMEWDGQPDDGKFKIQGGALTGPHLAGSFQGQDGGVGQFDGTKIYVDGNADNAPSGTWTPGAGTETANFFAPNTGGIQGAGAGDYGTP